MFVSDGCVLDVEKSNPQSHSSDSVIADVTRQSSEHLC
jgi:hypothetical protein